MVINQRLDHEKVLFVFTQQLGRDIIQLSEFNAYKRALLVIFVLLFILNNRQEVEELLDTKQAPFLIKSQLNQGRIGYPVFLTAHHAF
ncbi:hypothetical protein [Candidatus Williamhamiltonella defendens]|uniref:secretion/conjugation apparatus DotM-related subunit n=1 Tax=Candidatus Williamhamiltonella defendens TaxID=138072 RepID=UPI00130DF5A9|nr:hypothetical protein [Candidatus Hamiltonella defensa]